MKDLLEAVIASHGGRDRWDQIEEITASITSGGELFERKGRPQTRSVARVKAHAPYCERHPLDHIGAYSIYEPHRVVIKADNGKVIAEREDPRSAFAGHTFATPWDDLHVAYFGGYAIWEYLTTPFLFVMPGFACTEIAPWQEDGETWRRLKVVFPPSVPSHCTEQVFYFDDDAMLRRHDYNTFDFGGQEAANYASDYVSFDGITLPMKRRVYRRDANNTAQKDVVSVSLDMESPRATEGRIT